jgi:kanamycin kinase
VAHDRPLLPVWQNKLGGLTFQLSTGHDRLFVKWAPARSGLDLAGEVARLRWAADYTCVPQVLDQGHDDTGSWILLSAVPGESAVAARWKAAPETAVRAIGAGLRALHDALPVPDCPFSWSVTDRLKRARSAGIKPPLDLPAAPPVDHLVVCHGDPCAPNTLIREDGSWSGHVDMGALGIADRWADLAIATWSTQWNYGPGWEDALLEAYGIAPDAQRTAFYRTIWENT